MSRSALAAATLALAVGLAHLPHLPATLEDIDSVNFALATRHFDVADHRPHPPGYPVYIALAKTAVAVRHLWDGAADRASVEARAMAGLSLIGAVAALFALYHLLACFAPGGRDRLTPPWRTVQARALAATGLAAATPLFWYMAIRPMSDMPGLAAALAAQVCLALAWWRQAPDAHGDRRLGPEQMGASGGMIVAGSLLAGLAIGFRAQTAMLTLPLLALVLADRIGHGVAGALIGGGVAFAAGALIWAVPLVGASGGVGAYLAALGSQAGEDFASAEMLYVNPSPRLAAMALVRTFIYPWDSVALGATIGALAAIGLVSLLVRERRTIAPVVAITIPYLVFHVLFQDTEFTRYALPLVPPMAFLAVAGLERLPRRAAMAATGVLAVWGLAIAVPTTAAYAREASPTARVAKALRDHSAGASARTLAMHHTFQRPLQAEVLPDLPRLPSPPRREWLELAQYWREGRLEPLWFLADPQRSDEALIDPTSRRDWVDFTWRFSSLSAAGGMRPFGVRWYRLAVPGWFAEEGWALTPETAGTARLMGRGPHLAPIVAWVRRRAEPVRVLVGGRHLGAIDDGLAHFTMTADGLPLAEWDAAPGFFLHVVDVPADRIGGAGPWARFAVHSTSEAGTVPTAIEQFDVQTRGTLMWGYDSGWHEAEYQRSIGVWRWTSARATLRLVDATGPVTVRLRIESPRRYFDAPSHVRLVAGEHVVASTVLADTETWEVRIPAELVVAGGGRLSLETNQTFVPAERGGPPDRRALGLRVLWVEIDDRN